MSAREIIALLADDPNLDPNFRQVLSELTHRAPTGCGPDALTDDPEAWDAYCAYWGTVDL